MRRHISLLTVLIIAAASLGGIAAAQTTDLGTEHPLAENGTISDYQSTGYAEGELDRYQMGLAVATDGEDVGLDPSLARDTRNRYLQIDYREDHGRTIRLLLPREYVTPYTQETVESFDSDHVARFEPVRGGEYLEVVITFQGKGTAVLPLQLDSAASYGIIERVDSRIKTITGTSVFGHGSEWHYIDGSEVANEPAYQINATNTDSVLIQFDARPTKPSEVWLNAPKGEHSDADLYYFERNAGDEIYVVADNETAPDVRVKSNPSTADRVRGDINDIRLVPDRIREGAGDLPFFGGD